MSGSRVTSDRTELYITARLPEDKRFIRCFFVIVALPIFGLAGAMMLALLAWDLAIDVGFTSVSAFTRRFRSRYGMAPSGIFKIRK